MTTTAASPVARTASVLRRLYFVRFAFAIVWALLMFTTTKEIGPLAAVLLVLYPLFDVGAAVVDARSSRSSGSPALLYVNMAVSLIAAIAVAFAAASGVPAVLRVWGAWAIVAGAVQLVVGLSRRKLGGQWPIIVSGGVSVLLGVAFAVSAGAAEPSLAGPAGYAVGGGILFLISALRLGRPARAGSGDLS